MYVDYDFYTNSYFGNVINETDFPRLESRAGDKLYAITMGRIDNYLITDTDGNKVLDDSKVSSNIKKSICKIAEVLNDLEQAEKAYRQTVGFETDANGLTKSKTVSSISAGAESISYSNASSEDSILASIAKADKRTQDIYIFDSVRDYLGYTGLLSQAL